ncbi:hypothetical protein [Sinorhizobium alkalisoli]|uniref:hypothetical protein n=1 Tax=Sinorhizobium alkalisoli TaxID=1752398 RepID=UPI00124E1140|nr:hypothetical protein [Sinorhizobium alkalisoli]
MSDYYGLAWGGLSRAPTPRMNLAIISMAPPARMKAAATSHGKTDGQTAINTPRLMNAIPGITITRPESGFSIMPLQVSAIGHFGMGADCAIFHSSSLSSYLRINAA